MPETGRVRPRASGRRRRPGPSGRARAPKTRTAATSGTYGRHAAERRAGADAVEAAAGEDEREPDPAHHGAIPSPNATTRTNPKAGRPAAIEPSRMSSALVDGMRPPASPSDEQAAPGDRRAGRRAGGCGGCRRGCARRASAASCAWAWSPACGCVRSSSRSSAWPSWSGASCAMVRASWARGQRPPCAPSTDLAEQHPAADRHDRDGRHDRRRRERPRPARGSPARRRPAPRGRGSRSCATRSPTARDRAAWSGVPARPDEVGGHQRLAVPGRQGMPGAEGGRGQQRHQQDERREVGRAEDRRQVAALDAAGHAARPAAAATDWPRAGWDWRPPPAPVVSGRRAPRSPR